MKKGNVIINVAGIPPIISVPQQLSAPIIGQQFIIPCSIESTSNSLNEIQWIHIDFKGNVIDPIIISSQQPVKYQGSSVNNPSLVIHDYQSSDDGRYMCRATNNWGSSVSGAVLVTTESKLNCRYTLDILLKPIATNKLIMYNHIKVSMMHIQRI